MVSHAVNTDSHCFSRKSCGHDSWDKRFKLMADIYPGEFTVTSFNIRRRGEDFKKCVNICPESLRILQVDEVGQVQQ